MRNNPYVMMADQPIAEATTMEEVHYHIVFIEKKCSGLGAGLTGGHDTPMIHNRPEVNLDGLGV